MTNRLLKTTVVFLVIMVTQLACRTDRDSLVQPDLPDLTIEEAKAWMKIQTAGARAATGSKAAKRVEYWNAAKKLTYKNGLPVVVVPLAYNYDNQASFWKQVPSKEKRYDKSDHVIIKKLLVYKDVKGTMQADVILIIPINDSRAKNKKVKGDDWDGYVLAYDKAETKFMGGWYYEKGKAKRRARLNGSRNGRLLGVMGDCDILIYENSGGQQPAQAGSGDTSPATGYYDAGGNWWQLSQTITMDCNSAGGSGNDGTGSNPSPGNDTNTSDPGWTWSDSGQSGGGGGGNNGGGPDPYTPIMITEDGLIGASVAENFFYDMEYNRSPGIYFDEREKAIIREHDYLTSSLKGYIDQYGQKPDGSNAFKLSNDDQKKYPKFANFIRNNIRDYVMNRPKILNALKRFSGLTEEKIRAHLTIGQGPTIVVEQLTHPEFWGQDGYVYGKFDGKSPDIVKIDKLTLTYYEQTNDWPESEQAFFTLLAQTVIHEFCHYGANTTQTIDYTDGLSSTPQGGPYTHRFDIAAFGYANNPDEVAGYIFLKRAP